MATYVVTYPTSGAVSVEVEANSEEEAIERGWDLTDNPSFAEHNWEPMERIVEGHVFLGLSNRIKVERYTDDEEGTK